MAPTRKDIQYVWFDGETIQELKRRLNAIDRPLLKISGHGEHTQLDVIDLNRSPEVAAPTPLNEAHPCPPFCL